MSASFRVDISELRADLLALGAVADAETARIVESHARLFAADLPTRYPAGATGNLRGGVRLDKLGPRRFRVQNRAPHAHLYEFGTVRRFTSGSGANRGTMPARPVFVPQAIYWRTQMLQRTASWLRSLRVNGFRGTPEVRET